MTLDRLRCEGASEMGKLTAELRNIQQIEDIKKTSKHLTKRFNRIADLLIETRQFPNSTEEPQLIGDELFAELARIYEIPGGREAIEAAQKEAIQRINRARRYRS